MISKQICTIVLILISTFSVVQQDDSEFRFNLEEHRNKFKFENLTAFEIDDLRWMKRVEVYHDLTREEFYSVYQDSTRFYPEFKSKTEPDRDFFYSIENRLENFQEITILRQKEGEYCESITYMIYNKDGKLLSSFMLAGKCADGFFYNSKYGRFVNDSTYRLIIEEYEIVENDNYEHLYTLKTTTERTTRITENGYTRNSEQFISLDTIQ